METKEFSLFHGNRKIHLPLDAIRKYEHEVGVFNTNTLNHLVMVLDLKETMMEDTLSKKITEAMLEDCSDSAMFSKIIQNEEIAKNLLEGKCYKLDSETS